MVVDVASVEGPPKVMVSEWVEMMVGGKPKDAVTGGQKSEIDVKSGAEVTEEVKVVPAIGEVGEGGNRVKVEDEELASVAHGRAVSLGTVKVGTEGKEIEDSVGYSVE